MIEKMTAEELDALAETEDRIERAILTVTSLPETDLAKLKGGGSAWPEVVRNAGEAYGYEPQKRAKFRPTAKDYDRMLPDLELLLMHRMLDANGHRNYRIIWSRAFDLSWWRLAERAGRSERQVQRWYKDAMRSIHTLRMRKEKKD